MKIKIADVAIAPDRDPIVGETIDWLMDSIRDIGLLNAITVNTDYVLIAGAHRLEACRRLGWEEIEAHMVTLDGLRAELAEIDENLIRNSDAHYLDLDAKYLRRKEIYEALHPETKAGAIRAAGMNRSLGNNVTAETATTFNTDVAQKIGTPERTLRKSIQRARDIIPEAKEEIKKVGLGKEKAVEVARAPREQQVAMVHELAEKPSPRPVPAAAPISFPVPEQPRKEKSIMEHVRELKDPNRDRTQHLDNLWGAYSTAIYNFKVSLGSCIPEVYGPAFGEVDDAHWNEALRWNDEIRDLLDSFENYIMEARENGKEKSELA